MIIAYPSIPFTAVQCGSCFLGRYWTPPNSLELFLGLRAKPAAYIWAQSEKKTECYRRENDVFVLFPRYISDRKEQRRGADRTVAGDP